MDHGSSMVGALVPLLIVGAACLVGLGSVEHEARKEAAVPGYPAGGVFRWPTIALLFAASLAHVPVIGEHLEEARYMGVLFIGFVLASFGLATLLARHPAEIGYTAAGVLCAAAILTYAATRLVAFPSLGDDLGNWTEPWGLVSITAEAGVVLLCAMERSQLTRSVADSEDPRSGLAS
jgi:hypothetical protein